MERNGGRAFREFERRLEYILTVGHKDEFLLERHHDVVLIMQWRRASSPQRTQHLKKEGKSGMIAMPTTPLPPPRVNDDK